MCHMQCGGWEYTGESSGLEKLRFSLKCHLSITVHALHLIFMWLKLMYMKKAQFLKYFKA